MPEHRSLDLLHPCTLLIFSLFTDCVNLFTDYTSFRYLIQLTNMGKYIQEVEDDETKEHPNLGRRSHYSGEHNQYEIRVL
jgi:hypothetical protein